MDGQIYSETLTWLSGLVGGKRVVNATDIARAFGMDRRTAQARYPLQGGMIELPRLAKIICETEKRRW